jgi:hypothetical protein
MTVKRLLRELRYPPSKRIAQVRIEFADGSIFEVSPDMSPFFGIRRKTKGGRGTKPATSLIIRASR